jgi:hypothetical protein
MASKRFDAIVRKVIKTHGPTINLEENPEILLEIFRSLGLSAADDPYPPDNPCGGTPPAPGHMNLPIMEDIMRGILKLSREMQELKRGLGAGAALKSTRKAKTSRKR